MIASNLDYDLVGANYLYRSSKCLKWPGLFILPPDIHRGSYMSAHVLLNLLNKLGKRDKMRGLPSILSLFRNEFNKFNYTRARMLDSIYHMTNTLKSHFWRKNVINLSLCTQRCYGRHKIPVVYRFYCMVLFHSQTRRHMIRRNLTIGLGDTS